MSFESTSSTIALETPPLVSEALSSDVPAPTVAGILANPADLVSRESSKLFLYRTCEMDRPGCDGSNCLGDSVRSATEAEVLIDFDQKMSLAANALRAATAQDAPYDEMATHADKFRRELRFIGTGEFAAGTEAMAAHWLDKLNSSGAGELFVAICPDESSVLVYAAASEALRAMNPDAADQVHPIYAGNLSSLSYSGSLRLAKSGVIFVDDWTISGEQMSSIVSCVPHAVREGSGGVEVNMICAADAHVASGIGGVACRSHFVYPYFGDTQKVSLTGAHCDTDYGFRSQLSGLIPTARSVAKKSANHDGLRQVEDLPMPLMYYILRDYRPSMSNGANMMITEEEKATIEARRQRCRSSLATTVDVTAF